MKLSGTLGALKVRSLNYRKIAYSIRKILNTLLVSCIAQANLVMRFSGPHSLVDSKTTGFEGWKMFEVLFCS